MLLVCPLLVVALVAPLAVAGPRGGRFYRRTADDGTNKDLSSIITSSLTSTLTLTSSTLTSPTTPVRDLPSSNLLPHISGKDEISSAIIDFGINAPTAYGSTLDKLTEISTTTASTTDKPELIATILASSTDKGPITSIPLKDDKAPTNLPAKDQTPSLLVSTRPFAAQTSVGILYGTGSRSASESIQAFVVTDVLYTTLTTCPVTSTIISGNSAIEKVTTTISTITLTSTSTVCTKCVAPPKSNAQRHSTSGDETIISSLPSFALYSLTQPLSDMPFIQSFISLKTEATSTGSSPVIVYSFTLPKAPLITTAVLANSSKSETALSGSVSALSGAIIFPGSVLLAPSATPVPSIPGYNIVPSPTSIPGGPGPLFNATSSIIPVYSAALLGNAYGGGFIHTPSIYVTRLSSPSGASKGIPPGYGSSSVAEKLAAVVPEVFATIAEVVSSSGISKTIPFSFPPITIGTSNGSISIPLIAATGDDASKGPSNSLAPTGATVVAASNSEFSQTSIAVAIFQDVSALPAVLTTGGLPSGIEKSAPLVVAQSSLLTTGLSSNNGDLSIATTTPVVVADSATLSLPQITPLAGDKGTGIEGSIPVEIASSQSAGLISPTGAIGASVFSIAAPHLLVIEPSPTAPMIIPTIANVGEFPSSLVVVAGAPFVSNTTLLEGQSPSPSQIVAPILTPVVGANGLTSLAVVPSPDELASFATPSIPTEAGSNLASLTGAATPVLGLNGLSSLVVIPSPIVGANGLTSLAVFPSPTAAVNALPSPAVILTPFVGANGLTSLAVLATPIIGANGLTSLAIGLASEQGTTVALPGITSVSFEEPGFIDSPAAQSTNQISTPTQPLVLSSTASNIFFSSDSAGAFTGNASVHILLNPTAVIAEFQGTAVRLSLGCGISLIVIIMCVTLL